MRLFIGIPIGSRGQRQIDEFLRTVAPGKRRWRWIPEPNRHMTLAFIGDLPAPDSTELAEAFPAAYTDVRSFQYRLTMLERFPHRAARLVALTGKSTRPLENLVAATRSFLQREGISFDRIPFRPHITLARTGRAERGGAVVEAAADICLDVDRVVLYQSTLGRSGSVYSVLESSRLRRPGVRGR